MNSKTSTEIKRLAEDCAKDLAMDSSHIPAIVSTILPHFEKVVALRTVATLAQPQPMDREAMGKRLREITIEARIKLYGPETRHIFESYDQLSDKMQRTYNEAATQFALSIGATVGKCECDELRTSLQNIYKIGLRRDISNPTVFGMIFLEVSKALKLTDKNPFGSKEIQQGGGK